MRIIFLHPHFTVEGGAGRMVLETGKRLVARGHQVDCVCIRKDPQIAGADSGIVFHETGGPLSSELKFWMLFQSGSRRVAKIVGNIIADEKIGNCVLFPQVFPANWWASFILAQQPTLKCVWYCQEPSAFIHSTNWIRALPWPKNWIARALNPLLRRLDVKHCQAFPRILVNSQYSLSCAQDVYGYSNTRCEVVYPGLDPSRFNVKERENREPWIACVAKLTRFKNVDCIIDAVGQLVDAGDSKVQLHIVGTGDASAALQRRASRLGIEHRVVFHGRLPDVDMAKLLRRSRVLCLASMDEPFGLVAVEAMACGTPVIAVKRGGPAEIIGETQAGVLIERPEAALIARAIQELIDEPEKFEARSEAARQRAGDFDWEQTVSRLETIFLKVLE